MGFAKNPAALKVYLLKVAKIRTKVSVSHLEAEKNL
jgi:hypothetical protein